MSEVRCICRRDELAAGRPDNQCPDHGWPAVLELRDELAAARAEAQQLRRQLLDAELETRHWAGRNGDLAAENARLRVTLSAICDELDSPNPDVAYIKAFLVTKIRKDLANGNPA